MFLQTQNTTSVKRTTSVKSYSALSVQRPCVAGVAAICTHSIRAHWRGSSSDQIELYNEWATARHSISLLFPSMWASWLRYPPKVAVVTMQTIIKRFFHVRVTRLTCMRGSFGTSAPHVQLQVSPQCTSLADKHAFEAVLSYYYANKAYWRDPVPCETIWYVSIHMVCF